MITGDKNLSHDFEKIPLSKARSGAWYVMIDLEGGPGLKEKIYSMGLNPGARLRVLSNSGSGPLGIEVRQSKLALGRGVAGKIFVKEQIETKKESAKKELVIALAGNPNSGKSTIFNNLTGANQHVGNYPGVTVEKKEGYVNYGDYRIKVIDLPGTYSLSAHSLDEKIARQVILKEKPDIVIDVVDASNIERNLYLTTQFAELGVPLIIALNMSDMAEARGIMINHRQLSELLGVPIIPTVGNRRRGMNELLDAVIACAEGRLVSRPLQPKYGAEVEKELGKIEEIVSRDMSVLNGFKPRWLALKLIEDDPEVKELIEKHEQSALVKENIEKSRQRLNAIFGDDPSSVITERRYGFISGACSEAVSGAAERRHDISDTIDAVLIHPFFGLVIFGLLMWLLFHLTFTLSEKPVQLIELGVDATAGLANFIIPAGLLNSLVVDGIISGVGGVIVFLPNIMILFLAIAILEDTGYMARAAFIMDRLMHKIGLHGKSFIPMLIGFGCSVPAYMGSRIIEDKTDRLITMHVTTFMSCSARLPVYVLICGAFWPKNAGNVMFSIYVLGIIVAIGMVKLLRLTRFKGTSSPFVIELPPYRVPTLRSLLLHMWERSALYLRKAGTIILGISIVMWFLMTFPNNTKVEDERQALLASLERTTAENSISDSEKDSLINEIKSAAAAEKLESSFAGRIGKFIEPALAPLGFDWRLGVAIISGFAAKEVVVATMGTIYGVGQSADESSTLLRKKLAEDPRYTPLIAYTFLVFVLLYMPCMSAMAVFLRESGSLKEMIFQISYTTILAWLMAFAVYQGGRLIGLN